MKSVVHSGPPPTLSRKSGGYNKVFSFTWSLALILLSSCKYDDPDRDVLPGVQAQLLGKWEGLEVSETTWGQVIWVKGRGFEFLPDGQLILHIYGNRKFETPGSKEKDYDKIPGSYSLKENALSVTVGGEEATGVFPTTNTFLRIRFSAAEDSTLLKKVSKFKFE
ncbi:MAG: hypothetical protein U1G05_16660 [Kiritimatiellia bacterium]